MSTWLVHKGPRYLADQYFWVCLLGSFLMRLVLELLDWIKQIALPCGSGHIIRSVLGLKEQKSTGRENLPFAWLGAGMYGSSPALRLPGCLMPLTPWFLGPCTWLTYSPGFSGSPACRWKFGRLRQPPWLCEPDPHNQSPPTHLSLSLSLFLSLSSISLENPDKYISIFKKVFLDFFYKSHSENKKEYKDKVKHKYHS